LHSLVKQTRADIKEELRTGRCVIPNGVTPDDVNSGLAALPFKVIRLTGVAGSGKTFDLVDYDEQTNCLNQLCGVTRTAAITLTRLSTARRCGGGPLTFARAHNYGHREIAISKYTALPSRFRAAMFVAGDTTAAARALDDDDSILSTAEYPPTFADVAPDDPIERWRLKQNYLLARLKLAIMSMNQNVSRAAANFEPLRLSTAGLHVHIRRAIYRRVFRNAANLIDYDLFIVDEAGTLAGKMLLLFVLQYYIVNTVAGTLRGPPIFICSGSSSQVRPIECVNARMTEPYTLFDMLDDPDFVTMSPPAGIVKLFSIRYKSPEYRKIMLKVEMGKTLSKRNHQLLNDRVVQPQAVYDPTYEPHAHRVCNSHKEIREFAELKERVLRDRTIRCNTWFFLKRRSYETTRPYLSERPDYMPRVQQVVPTNDAIADTVNTILQFLPPYTDFSHHGLRFTKNVGLAADTSDDNEMYYIRGAEASYFVGGTVTGRGRNVGVVLGFESTIGKLYDLVNAVTSIELITVVCGLFINVDNHRPSGFIFFLCDIFERALTVCWEFDGMLRGIQAEGYETTTAAAAVPPIQAAAGGGGGGGVVDTHGGDDDDDDGDLVATIDPAALTQVEYLAAEYTARQEEGRVAAAAAAAPRGNSSSSANEDEQYGIASAQLDCHFQRFCAILRYVCLTATRSDTGGGRYTELLTMPVLVPHLDDYVVNNVVSLPDQLGPKLLRVDVSSVEESVVRSLLTLTCESLFALSGRDTNVSTGAPRTQWRTLRRVGQLFSRLTTTAGAPIQPPAIEALAIQLTSGLYVLAVPEVAAIEYQRDSEDYFSYGVIVAPFLIATGICTVPACQGMTLPSVAYNPTMVGGDPTFAFVALSRVTDHTQLFLGSNPYDHPNATLADPASVRAIRASIVDTRIIKS